MGTLRDDFVGAAGPLHGRDRGDGKLWTTGVFGTATGFRLDGGGNAIGIAETDVNDTAFAYVDDADADVTLSSAINTVGSGTDASLLFRFVDPNNYIQFGYNSFQAGFRLFYRTAGVLTMVDVTTAVAPADGQILQVVTLGTNIKCYVGTTLVLDTTLSDHSTATKHGLITSNTDNTTRQASYAWYEITADTISSLVNSPTSASVSGTSTEPIPPATTVAASGGAGEIVITWNSISEADGYRLYKDNVQIADYPATYSHTDGGLGYSVTHSYYVVTYNTAGDGPQSNVATATTYPDPLTPFVIEYGRRPYRLLVVDRFGTSYAELENARIGPLTWSLNQLGSLTFDLPCEDPKINECLTPEREVQCWRGDTLIWWGVLVRARGDDKVVNFQAQTLEWYFTRRVIGAVPNPNLLTNGSFETELTAWTAEYGNLEPDKSHATKLPTSTIVTSTVLSGTRAVELSTDLTNNHKWLKSQQVFTNDSGRPITATCVAWSFLKTFRGPSAGEHGLTFVRYDTTVLDPHPDLAAQGLKKIHAYKTSVINVNSPIGVWQRHEVSLEIPPDGLAYNLAARLHVPNGVVVWDEVSIKTDLSGLKYTNYEQGYIFTELVTHAQDPFVGKSDVNIKASAPVSGVKRTRTYEVGTRDRIYDALTEFATLASGMDVDMEFTPTTRTIKGYFPRKGGTPGTTLALGTNILGFTLDVDAERTSTTVIVQAEGEGSDREEGVAQDPTLLNGLVLETVYNATPGSSISSLQAQADRGLARYRRPVTIPSVTTHQDAGHLLSQVKVGDIVPVKISKGWVQVNALYRIVEISLDPNTEEITYVLAPEDIKIKVLNDWGATGWKYLTGDQTLSTTATNTLPVETHPEYADPAHDTSTWLTGQAAIGWAFGTAPTDYQGSVVRNTEITEKHELWMRKTVAVTGDMILYTRVDNFGYLYVNGNKIVDPFIESRDANLAYVERGPFRVPQVFLNPNGQQVITLHVQDKLSGYASGDVFVGDVKVMGTLPDDYVFVPPALVNDTFNRANAPLSGSTTSGGQTWDVSGSHDIVSNQVRKGAGGTSSIATGRTVNGLTVELDVTYLANDAHVQTSLHTSTAGEYIAIQQGRIYIGSTQIVIYAGDNAGVDTGWGGATAGQVYRFKVTINGTTLTVTATHPDGRTATASYTLAAAVTGPRVALQITSAAADPVAVDNFVVRVP